MLARALLAVLLTISTTDVVAATFTVTASSGTGPGSLRQAVLDANARPGRDQIRFAVFDVTVTGPLQPIPEITDPVDIEGPVWITSGPATDISRGFVFAPGSQTSTLRNVRVPSFVEPVHIHTNGVTIDRVHIGDLTLRILGGNDNLVQDSELGGLVRINGARNVFLRNTAASYTAVFSTDTRIGSTGNGNAIYRFDNISSTGTIVEGNTFTPRPLTSPTAAILVEESPASNVIIRGNTIRSYPAGIRMHAEALATTAAQIIGNSIYDVGIPIDLGANGVTPNDPAPDADIGPNNYQNFPVLASATLTASSLTVQGTLTSAPLTTYLVELFSDEEGDPEPRVLLASFDVTTDVTGNASFTHTVATPLPAPNDAVVATATNRTTRDTSEVSAPVAIAAPGTLGFANTTYTVNETDGALLVTVNRTGGSEGIVTVQYATQNGTAIAPVDYTATSGTLTFAPGVTSQTFSVPIVGDGIPEPAEAFTIVLSGATGGATIGNATTTVTIATQLPASPTEIPTLSTWAMLAMIAALALLAMRR